MKQLQSDNDVNIGAPILASVSLSKLLVLTSVAVIVALIAAGHVEEFVPGYPFQLLTGRWLVAITGAVGTAEIWFIKRVGLSMLSYTPLLCLATSLCSLAAIIIWICYNVARSPWIVTALFLACVICMLLGTVAVALGKMQHSRPVMLLGWCGVASLLFLCGGNFWITVLDATGAVIPSSEISIGTHSLTADENGSASLSLVPYSTYDVRARDTGFGRAEYNELALPLLFPKRSRVTLEVGDGNSAVVVERPLFKFVPVLVVAIYTIFLLAATMTCFKALSARDQITAAAASP